MAKSVRSRTTKTNRDRKRATGFFKNLAEERELKIAERLHGSLEKALGTAQPDAESSQKMQTDEDGSSNGKVTKGLSTGNSKKKRAALKAKAKRKKGGK